MMLDNATSLETVRIIFFFQNVNCAQSFAMLLVSFGRLNCFKALMAVARSDAVLVFVCAG